MEFRSPELGKIRELMKETLRQHYAERELHSIVNGLLSHITGLSPAQMVIEKDRVLTESEIYYLQWALKRLKDHEPLQYIIGKTWFHGLELMVNSNVLIPRPETEELVEWIIQDHKSAEMLSILDIGTGSACIAISLKKNLPMAKIDAIDLSADALEVAEQNDHFHDTCLNLMQTDILNEKSRADLGNYNIIVSNPPYVTPSDREKMRPNVTKHEPKLALFVEDDPLVFYREIIAFSRDHLDKGGRVYFECNESNASHVVNLLKNSGFTDVELKKDMQGKDRMVKGINPGN